MPYVNALYKESYQWHHILQIGLTHAVTKDGGGPFECCACGAPYSAITRRRTLQARIIAYGEKKINMYEHCLPVYDIGVKCRRHLRRGINGVHKKRDRTVDTASDKPKYATIKKFLTTPIYHAPNMAVFRTNCLNLAIYHKRIPMLLNIGVTVISIMLYNCEYWQRLER